MEKLELDLSVKPVDGFYQFVNGQWLKDHPIPAYLSSWGKFAVLTEDAREKLHQLLEEIAQNKDVLAGSNLRKLRDFYLTGMGTVKLEREEAKPLQGEFERIEGISNIEELISQVAHLHSVGISVLWSLEVEQDAKNTEKMVLWLFQGGLGLPDRDYYLKTDKASKKIRQQYLKHIAKMLMLLGDTKTAAVKTARIILRLETRLAESCMAREELRDIEKQYNKVTIGKLKKASPNISWQRYFQEIKAPGIKRLIVAQPIFIQKVNDMLRNVSLYHWKAYLRWHLINGAAEALSDDFVNEDFNFYGKILSGTKELRPRWQRCIMTVNSALGEALGEIYVSRYFSPEAKQKVNDIVDNLLSVCRNRIKALDWMSVKTKKMALKKLGALNRKIGYPDKWLDYSAMDIRPDSYVLNHFRAFQFHFRRQLNKLGKPVDRQEWQMYPQTVNAYFHPFMNEIVFPAAILQPPFFDHRAPDAMNYGAIGTVIGHEITHCFDDQGSKFDAKGNLKNWWQKRDRKRFMEKAKALVEQAESYIVLDNLHLNGKLTLGENIADLGGVSIAFEAFQRSLEGKERPPDIDGFTPEQLFFIGFARTEAMNIRDEEAKKRLITDPHSPARFRVNGPLSNMGEFYEAFGIEKGDGMWRDERLRAKIW